MDLVFSPDPAADGFAQQLSQQHLLWGYQRVLDTYGKPQSISADDTGVSWFYWAENKSGEKRNLRVRFVEGYVRYAGVN